MKKQFTLTVDHITLANHMLVRWGECEYGAPEIDGKRPYGNSDVEADVADLLGWKQSTCPHCEEVITDTSEKVATIHREMETAVQILLSRAGDVTQPGMYEGEWANWTLVSPSNA